MKKRNNIKELKRFLSYAFILIMVVSATMILARLIRFPEMYLPTWKYQLQNDIARGDIEAIAYYERTYTSKGVNLFD